jgi:hypothetical protein
MEEPPDLAWHPLGELLVEQGLITAADLRIALEVQQHTGRLIGEILVSRRLITPGDVERALDTQHSIRLARARWAWEHSFAVPPQPRQKEGDGEAVWRPLGQVLLEQELITEDGLARALLKQKRTGQLLGEILVKRRWLKAEDIERALAVQRGLTSAEKPPATEDAAPPRPTARFEVREGDTAASELLAACSDFLEATDVAFDVLEERAPDRLETVKIEGDRQEVVWTYDRTDAEP